MKTASTAPSIIAWIALSYWFSVRFTLFWRSTKCTLGLRASSAVSFLTASL